MCVRTVPYGSPPSRDNEQCGEVAFVGQFLGWSHKSCLRCLDKGKQKLNPGSHPRHKCRHPKYLTEKPKPQRPLLRLIGSARVVNFAGVCRLSSPSSWVSFQIIEVCETTQAVYRQARPVILHRMHICIYTCSQSPSFRLASPLTFCDGNTSNPITSQEYTYQLFPTMYDRVISSFSNNQFKTASSSPIYIWAAALQRASKGKGRIVCITCIQRSPED